MITGMQIRDEASQAAVEHSWHLWSLLVRKVLGVHWHRFFLCYIPSQNQVIDLLNGHYWNVECKVFNCDAAIPYGCKFESWLLDFQSSSLLMHLGKPQRMGQVLGTLLPT